MPHCEHRTRPRTRPLAVEPLEGRALLAPFFPPVTLNGSATLVDNGHTLQLTNAPNQAGSAYLASPSSGMTRQVLDAAFVTSFNFKLAPDNPLPGFGLADGITFIVRGVHAIATGQPGGGLGSFTVDPSVAIKFDTYDNDGEGPNSTGLFLDGDYPSTPDAPGNGLHGADTLVNLNGTGIDLHSGHTFNVVLAYFNQQLTERITDTTTHATSTTHYTVNIPAIIGSNFANVGFTGGTGFGSSVQTVSSWFFF